MWFLCNPSKTSQFIESISSEVWRLCELGLLCITYRYNSNHFYDQIKFRVIVVYDIRQIAFDGVILISLMLNENLQSMRLFLPTLNNNLLSR